MYPTLLLAVAMAAVVSIQARAGQSPESGDLTQLSRLEEAWNEAHIRGDAAVLDRLWADDLVVTVPGMAIMGKPATIGVWRSGRMRFDRYETSEIRTRVYGDAAVVTGRLRRSRSAGGRLVDDDWRFTKVYVRRDGRWQVVAWHASAAEP